MERIENGSRKTIVRRGNCRRSKRNGMVGLIVLICAKAPSVALSKVGTEKKTRKNVQYFCWSIYSFIGHGADMPRRNFSSCLLTLAARFGKF